MPSGAGRITVVLDLLEHRSRPPSSSSSTPRPTGSRRRPVRDDGGRRGARRRRRAARPLLVARHANLPLGRGIQRFTGITQEMVDDAPALEAVLPSDRGAPAGTGAGRPQRAVRPPRAAPGVRADRPRVAQPSRCSARRRSRARCCRSSASAGSRLGRRARDRGRGSLTGRWPTPRRARACCARCSRGCARTRRRSGTRSRCSGRRRRRAQPLRGRQAARSARSTQPPQLDFGELPHDPGVYLFRDDAGRTLYVGKSVSIRSRARAHFAPSAPPADWTPHATVVDYKPTSSELGALVLENRLIKELRPPGNIRLTQRRRPARLHPLPARHPVPDPRGRRRGPPPATRSRSARCAAGALARRAGRAARLAVRPASLRPQAAAPRAPVGLRADGPLPVAVPRRSRPESVPAPARRTPCACS